MGAGLQPLGWPQRSKRKVLSVGEVMESLKPHILLVRIWYLEVLNNLDPELPCDPASSLPSVYPKNNQTMCYTQTVETALRVFNR